MPRYALKVLVSACLAVEIERFKIRREGIAVGTLDTRRLA